MALGGQVLRLVVVGTVAGDSFLWSWANDDLPARCKEGIERVRAFGLANDLGLLSAPCLRGGLAQAKECVAISLRILDATAIWIDATGPDRHLAFVLFDGPTASSSR